MNGTSGPPEAGRATDQRGTRDTDTPFGAGVPLGHWWGVPVRAHWSVLVAMALFAVLIAAVDLPQSVPDASPMSYWAAGVVMAPLLFLTLLAHELAHAVTARHHRLGVRRINLWMLGGLTELEGRAPSPKADAQIAASGPLTSLAIGVLCAAAAAVAPGGDVVTAALGWLAGINVLLAIFNLLPGAPLDGGRLLRALLWWHGHDQARAADQASRAGRVLGMVIIALGVLELLAGSLFALWTLLIGWFIVSGAATEQYSVQADSLAGLTVRDAMSPTPQLLPEWWTAEHALSTLSPAATRQDIFPLVDVDGRFSGAVTLAVLTHLRAEQAASTRLRDLAHARQLLTTAPEDALGTLLLPLHLRGGLAVVLDGERPVGVITDADLARSAQLARAARSQSTGPG